MVAREACHCGGYFGKLASLLARQSASLPVCQPDGQTCRMFANRTVQLGCFGRKHTNEADAQMSLWTVCGASLGLFSCFVSPFWAHFGRPKAAKWVEMLPKLALFVCRA